MFGMEMKAILQLIWISIHLNWNIIIYRIKLWHRILLTLEYFSVVLMYLNINKWCLFKLNVAFYTPPFSLSFKLSSPLSIESTIILILIFIQCVRNASFLRFCCINNSKMSTIQFMYCYIINSIYIFMLFIYLSLCLFLIRLIN